MIAEKWKRIARAGFIFFFTGEGQHLLSFLFIKRWARSQAAKVANTRSQRLRGTLQWQREDETHDGHLTVQIALFFI